MPDEDKSCIDRGLIDRANIVLQKLAANKLTVVTAESCTAGLISAVLSQAEGAGTALHGSFVTYTKANKTKALGVDAELLKNEGSVNEETVRQLALGALERSPADIALAVSGVLGPEPDEDGNPVGLVFFCCCRRNETPRTFCKDYGCRPPDRLRHTTVLDGLAVIESCLSTNETHRSHAST